MSTITILKLLLITCIAGLAAAMVSVGYGEKASILAHATGTETHQAAPRMCGAARAPMIRLPVYKRYLNQTPAMRFTPRRHG